MRSKRLRRARLFITYHPSFTVGNLSFNNDHNKVVVTCKKLTNNKKRELLITLDDKEKSTFSIFKGQLFKDFKKASEYERFKKLLKKIYATSKEDRKTLFKLARGLLND